MAISFASFGVLFTLPPELITTFNNSKKSADYRHPLLLPSTVKVYCFEDGNPLKHTRDPNNLVSSICTSNPFFVNTSIS